MPVLTKEASRLSLPRMFTARQIFDDTRLDDIANAIRKELGKPEIRSLVRPSAHIAVAVGSRGIHSIDRITRALVDGLKAMGATPFIVPSMGSHGSGTAEGQSQLLAQYGITEKTMGVAILSSMETMVIGKTASGTPIHLSKDALVADLIVPVARIKPHTDFRGAIESGLCKMLAIGLGKHNGCSQLHREGFSRFDTLIPEVAQRIINHAPIGFGLAIIENAYDKTVHIEAVPGKAFLSREPEWLIPVFGNRRIDPGTNRQECFRGGNASNVMGHSAKGPLPDFDGPLAKRIVVPGLNEAAKGNFLLSAAHARKRLKRKHASGVSAFLKLRAGNLTWPRFVRRIASSETVLKMVIVRKMVGINQ